MQLLYFKDFMKKYNLKNDTMYESQLRKVFNYPIYLRGSKIYSDRGFVNLDNEKQNETHWTAFLIKDRKS